MNNEDRKADLEPFIESIRGNGNDSAEYIAGFRDAQGEIAGPVVPLSAEVVQRAVFSGQLFTVMCDMAGEISPCPAGIVEDLLDTMFGDGRLATQPIDELVEEAIGMSVNETADTMIADLEIMRDRLKRALMRVEDTAQALRTIKQVRRSSSAGNLN
ncbi:hypothetical protein [Shinella zoogloeoides]|mgnify:CR=1 FL=1|jgi:hypothetical protein|uniref:Uncharacterized protein n=1 Tax=Shinella zoogloeoides TaxID=352475 RepID=A0A6N8TI80_SHIZO|nr:hypothetical protein [Shinella zoogloeoides]MXO02963.1 hypothetical protein [Shinella zoogloeoides]